MMLDVTFFFGKNNYNVELFVLHRGKFQVQTASEEEKEEEEE